MAVLSTRGWTAEEPAALVWICYCKKCSLLLGNLAQISGGWFFSLQLQDLSSWYPWARSIFQTFLGLLLPACPRTAVSIWSMWGVCWRTLHKFISTHQIWTQCFRLVIPAVNYLTEIWNLELSKNCMTGLIMLFSWDFTFYIFMVLYYVCLLPAMRTKQLYHPVSVFKISGSLIKHWDIPKVFPEQEKPLLQSNS